jgi:hypothetical protein
LVTRLTCLAGVQMKLGMSITYGCDPCWEPFIEAKAEALAKLAAEAASAKH